MADLKLFPEELWSTLEGRSGERVKAHIEIAQERQRRVRKFPSSCEQVILTLEQRALGIQDPEAEAEAEARMKAMMERIHKLDDNEAAVDDDEPADEAGMCFTLCCETSRHELTIS